MPISQISAYQPLCHSATVPPSQPLRIITISHHAYHVHQPRCHLATITYHVCAYQSSDLFSLPLSLSACLWTKTYHFRIEKGNIYVGKFLFHCVQNEPSHLSNAMHFSKDIFKKWIEFLLHGKYVSSNFANFSLFLSFGIFIDFFWIYVYWNLCSSNLSSGVEVIKFLVFFLL